MKLSNKIHVYTTVVFVILLVLVVTAIYFSFSRLMYSSELDQAQDQAAFAVSGISSNQSDVPRLELVRAYVPANGMIKIVDENGQVLTAVTGGSSQQELIEINTDYQPEEVTEIRDYFGTPHAFVSIPVIWENGQIAALQWTEDLSITATNLRILLVVLLVVTIVAIIPSIISARLLSNVITNPITSLISTMKQIRGSGQFQQIDPPQKSKDELYEMTKTFNEMIEQLQNNYEKQEQFVSNASHELKTPLTVIESYASLLRRRGKQEEELFKESVEAIESEAERMRELTQQLLLLAKNEEQWSIKITSHSLTSIVQSTVRSFVKAYQREVHLEIEADVFVETDENKLKQLLYIFMDNARKYSEDSISVEVKHEGDFATIRIEDRGIGISSEDLPKVFDRFYRVDKARSRKAGGYGLGLSLAKELSRALGAEIDLESELGTGTKARIRLPIKN
ncbi:HAMP domain-containing histidine kinase [Halobacillus fulvus]|nr:HAMP domain-containing histidine kinase [Halobacillus fulvus]